MLVLKEYYETLLVMWQVTSAGIYEKSAAERLVISLEVHCARLTEKLAEARIFHI